METSTTEDTSSDLDDFESSDDSSAVTDQLGDHFRPLAIGSTPQHQQPSESDHSQPSSITGRDIIHIAGTTTFNPSPISPSPTRDFQDRGRTLRHRRPRGHHHFTSSSTPTGDRIRELIRRPRCGLHLLRSLRNDKQLCIPEARSNSTKPPRHPGRVDKHFCPQDGDLLLHHVKRLGKHVVEFFDPEQPVRFQDGDYLLRFKVDNYSFMHQSFVIARGYLYHHGHWVYLGKDSDQMELA